MIPKKLCEAWISKDDVWTRFFETKLNQYRAHVEANCPKGKGTEVGLPGNLKDTLKNVSHYFVILWRAAQGFNPKHTDGVLDLPTRVFDICFELLDVRARHRAERTPQAPRLARLSTGVVLSCQPYDSTTNSNVDVSFRSFRIVDLPDQLESSLEERQEKTRKHQTCARCWAAFDSTRVQYDHEFRRM